MLVAPAPVCLLIVFVEPGKCFVFAMVLFSIHAIRLIFLSIPLMIVVVLFVVVGASGFLILGSQRCGRNSYGNYKGGAQQGCFPETWHGYFHNPP